jgi:hypothetical protein
MISAFKRQIHLILIISFLILFQGCPNKEFYDCTSDLNLDEFHFLGTHDVSHHISTTGFQSFPNNSWPIPNNSANIDFIEDGTFDLKVNVNCDTTWVYTPNICEYLNLTGASEELVWDGTWELAYSSTFLQECDINTECQGIKGEVYLKFQNVPDGLVGTYNNINISYEFEISCTGRNTRVYYMDIDLPIFNEFELSFEILSEENIN